jgi:hypothetical protein
MKPSLSSQNAYKMERLNKVSFQQKQNKLSNNVFRKNFEVQLKAMQRLPRSMTHLGKMKNTTLKQAMNFAKRKNIQGEEYSTKDLNTKRRNIEDLLRKIYKEPSSSFARSVKGGDSLRKIKDVS